LDEWLKRDPIERHRHYLEDNGLLEEGEADELKTRAEAEVKDALTWAEAQPDPEPESVFRNVFAEPPP
jgi:TPP-dependent pyruvate/acetoin dehydrogenase alpha subunit